MTARESLDRRISEGIREMDRAKCRTVIVDGGSRRGLDLASRRLRAAGLEVSSGAGASDGVVGMLVDPERPVSDDQLTKLPNLRVIATASIGFDHINVEGAAELGISVCSVPDYCVEEVADSTVAMLLDLLRAVTIADREVREGAWRLPEVPMRRIAGTALGLIGFGAIARRVAAKAQALGMDVAAVDPRPPPDPVPGVPLLSLDALLRRSDAVSLHAPLTKASRGLIGERELQQMPNGSFLINTSRGGLIDDRAVLRALDSGRLAGAALDVLPEEPPGRTLPRHPRLIVTPHCAWYTPEAEAAAYLQAAEAIIATLHDRLSPISGLVPGAVVGDEPG